MNDQKNQSDLDLDFNSKLEGFSLEVFGLEGLSLEGVSLEGLSLEGLSHKGLNLEGSLCFDKFSPDRLCLGRLSDISHCATSILKIS